MNVLNVHERTMCAPVDAVGKLIDSLSSSEDRLWPRRWPPMRFDRPLAVGAVGGHGPIRYCVGSYEPGISVTFVFTAPRGFAGTHRFEVERIDGESSRLRHVLEMRATGKARITWPLVYRPLHDALIEDALDRASAALGCGVVRARWSLYVRLLRKVLRRKR
jgi:hypothetical protein